MGVLHYLRASSQLHPPKQAKGAQHSPASGWAGLPHPPPTLPPRSARPASDTSPIGRAPESPQGSPPHAGRPPLAVPPTGRRRPPRPVPDSLFPLRAPRRTLPGPRPSPRLRPLPAGPSDPREHTWNGTPNVVEAGPAGSRCASLRPRRPAISGRRSATAPGGRETLSQPRAALPAADPSPRQAHSERP